MKTLFNLSLATAAMAIIPMSANAFFCGSNNKSYNQGYTNYQAMPMRAAYANQGQQPYMQMPRPPVAPTPPMPVSFAAYQPMTVNSYQQPRPVMRVPAQPSGYSSAPMQAYGAQQATVSTQQPKQAVAPSQQSTNLQVEPQQAPANKSVEEKFSPKTVQVSINGMKFQPATLKVKAGDSVEWLNMSQMPHTVTSTGNKELASAQMGNGGKFKHTFEKPGAYTYQCAIHPSMTGQVIVE